MTLRFSVNGEEIDLAGDVAVQFWRLSEGRPRARYFVDQLAQWRDEFSDLPELRARAETLLASARSLAETFELPFNKDEIHDFETRLDLLALQTDNLGLTYGRNENFRRAKAGPREGAGYPLAEVLKVFRRFAAIDPRTAASETANALPVMWRDGKEIRPPGARQIRNIVKKGAQGFD